jgi:histone H2B
MDKSVIFFYFKSYGRFENIARGWKKIIIHFIYWSRRFHSVLDLSNMGKVTKTETKKNDVKSSVAESVGKPSSRRRKNNMSSFDSYIYRVLKQVHPNHGISRKGMMVMNSLCSDMFERVCQEAACISRYGKRNTLTAKDVQTATHLIFPGSLYDHARSAGVQSVARFNAGMPETN